MHLMCMAFACKGNPEVACVVEVGHALAIADDFNTSSTSMY